MKRFILLFCLLAFTVLNAQLSITITTPLGTYFNEFYPAQFNPEEPESQPEFFILNITGAYTDPYKINFFMEWNGITAETNIMTEDGGPFPFPMSNRNFINNDPIGLDIDNADAFDDILNEIEDYILETGRIPDGSYLFRFTAFDMEDPPNQISQPATMTLVIQAPLAIGLITPGSPIGLPPTEITNQNPDFIWFSNLEDYVFSIYDITELAEDQRTADNIVNLDPYYQPDDPMNAMSLALPNSHTLELNRTYAWRVAAPINVPIGRGSIEYSSIFYLLKVVTQSGMDPEEIILENFLNNVSGEQAAAILELLAGGYALDTIVWEGNTITVEQLMAILQQIMNGDLEFLQGP